MNEINDKLSKLYKQRFTERDMIIKDVLWKILVDTIIQKYIKEQDVVLDLGGGECFFINNVKCGKKYVVDLNPDTKKYADADIITVQQGADNISDVHDSSIDVVFVSNFFEHLKDKTELERVIQEIKRILKKNGSIIIIQPNIRYEYKRYWDYHDHYIPISDNSLKELLVINNFRIKTCYPRFLPWSPKMRGSGLASLFKIYLRFPLLWRVFGKQLFIVAENLTDS